MRPSKRRPQNLNVRDARKILEVIDYGYADFDLKWEVARLARRIEKRSLKADARTGRDEKSKPLTAGAKTRRGKS